MSPFRSRWIHDGVADLEREIIGTGFIRAEAFASHLLTVVRFTVGPYQRIADAIGSKTRDGGTIAEAIVELDPEDRAIANRARAEHQDDPTDFDRLDRVVRLQAKLAEYLGEEWKAARE